MKRLSKKLTAFLLAILMVASCMTTAFSKSGGFFNAVDAATNVKIELHNGKATGSELKTLLKDSLGLGNLDTRYFDTSSSATAPSGTISYANGTSYTFSEGVTYYLYTSKTTWSSTDRKLVTTYTATGDTFTVRIYYEVTVTTDDLSNVTVNSTTQTAESATYKVYNGDSITITAAGKTGYYAKIDSNKAALGATNTQTYKVTEDKTVAVSYVANTASTVKSGETNDATVTVNGSNAKDGVTVEANTTATVVVTPTNNTYITKVSLGEEEVTDGTWDKGVYTFEITTGATSAVYTVNVETGSPVISGIPDSIPYNPETMTAAQALKKIVDEVKPEGATVKVKANAGTYEFDGENFYLVIWGNKTAVTGTALSVLESSLASKLADGSIEVTVTYDATEKTPESTVDKNVTVYDPRGEVTLEWTEMPEKFWYSKGYSEETDATNDADIYNIDDVLAYVKVKGSGGEDVSLSGLTVTAYIEDEDGNYVEVTTLSGDKTYKFVVSFDGNADYKAAESTEKTLFLEMEPTKSEITNDGKATYTLNGVEMTETVGVTMGSEVAITVAPVDNNTYISKVYINNVEAEGTWNNGTFTVETFTAGKRKTYNVTVDIAEPVIDGIPDSIGYNEHMEVIDVLSQILTDIKPTGATVEVTTNGVLWYVFDGTSFVGSSTGLDATSLVKSTMATKFKNDGAVDVRVTYNGGGEGSNLSYAQVTKTVTLVENRSDTLSIKWNVKNPVYYSNNTEDSYSPDVYAAKDVLQFVTLLDPDGKDVTSKYKSMLTVTVSPEIAGAGNYEFAVKFSGDVSYLPTEFASKTITLVNVPGFSKIEYKADGATATGDTSVQTGGYEAAFTVTPGDNRYITSVTVTDEDGKTVAHTGDYTSKGVYAGTFVSGAYSEGEKVYTVKVTTAPVITFDGGTISYNKLMSPADDALPEIRKLVTAADGISTDALSFAYNYGTIPVIGTELYWPLTATSSYTFGPSGDETEKTEKIRVIYTSTDKRYPDVTVYADVKCVDDRETPVLTLKNAEKVYELTEALAASVAYNEVFVSLVANDTDVDAAFENMTVTCVADSVDANGYGTYTVTATFKETAKYHYSNTATAILTITKPDFTATVQNGSVDGAVVKRGDIDLADGPITVEAEEDKVTLTVTPNSGKYISSIEVDKASDTDVTFSGTVATVTFSTERDTVYTVNVVTGDAVLVATDGEICVNEYVTNEQIIEQILALVNAESSVPVPTDDGTFTVTYYAGIVPVFETTLWESIDYSPVTPLAHKFGANATEQVRITYDADGDKYPETTATITVTIVDSRQEVLLTLNEGQSTVYSPTLTEEDIFNLVFASLIGGEDGLDVETVYGENIHLAIDSLDAGTYTVTVTYDGSAQYAPATQSVEFTIEKADCEVVVESQTVSYAQRDTVSGMIYTDPDGVKKITFVVGLNAAEGKSYVHVDLPSFIDIDSIEDENIKSIVSAIVTPINEGLDSTLSLSEFADYLEKAISALEKIEETIGIELPINIDTATLNSLISALRTISELDGVGDMDIKVTINSDIVPENSGIYLVGAVTADNNYNTDASVGYLVIVPDTVEATLGFNIDDENGIITRGSILSGDYDLGSHVEKNGLTNAQYATATERLHNIYLGINTDGTFYLSNEPSAEIGAYTQIAYIVDWGNEVIWAKPIVRAYVVIADLVDVKFIDENGNENNDRIFTYDGTPKAMTAKAFDRDSNELDSSNITYYYIGIEGDAEGYYSSEAPTAAGVYTVTAVYLDDDHIHAGAAVGAMVIAPADAEVNVDNVVHTYDGNAVNVINMIEKTPDDAKMTVIVAGIDVNGDFSENGFAAVDGVVNVDFPARVDKVLANVIPDAYTNGVTVKTFVQALEKAKSALESAGIDTTAIDDIIEMLSAMPDSVTLTFKETSEINPAAIGAYVVAAVITDPDYKADADIGTLFIIPEVTEVELEWNYNDLNGIITRPVLDIVDLDATAFVDSVANDEFTARIEYIIVGVDENGNAVFTDDASNLPNGIYTQVAYIVDEISADMYVAKPIIRSFILVEQTVDVEVTDKKVTYDGNAHAVDIKVTDLAGNEITGDRLNNLTVTYTGVNLTDGLYRSSEAPVNAGVYAVTALYVEYDEDGNRKYVGLDVGTLTIEPAEAEFEVIDTTTCYTGDGKFTKLNNPENLDYIAVIVDKDNNVNVIFPDSWGIESGSYDVDTTINEIVARLEELKVDVNLRETVDEIIAELENAYDNINVDEIVDKLTAELEKIKDEVVNSDEVQAIIDELKALKDEVASSETVQAIIDALKKLESGEIVDSAIAELEALKEKLLANEDVQRVIAALKDLKNKIASDENVQAVIEELKALKEKLENTDIIDKAIAELEKIKDEILANEDVQAIINKLKELKDELVNSDTAEEIAAKLDEIKAELKALADELGTNEYVTAALAMLASLKEMISGIESPEEALATLKETIEKAAEKILAALNDELGNLQDALNTYNAAIDKLTAILDGIEINTLTINGALPVEVGVYDVTCIAFDENHKPVVDDGILTIIHKFYVAFDANGGEGTMETQEFDYDEPQALYANSFTREGYEFFGWALSADGDVVYTDKEVVSNLTDVCKATVTLYAVWEEIPEEDEIVDTYSIYFHENTGDETTDAEVTNMPEDITKRATPNFVIPENVPVRDGYKFLGWSTTPDGAAEYNPGDAYTVVVSNGRARTVIYVENSNNLYAVWEKNPVETEVEGGEDTKTGDSFNETLWISIMIFFAAALVTIVILSYRKRREEA